MAKLKTIALTISGLSVLSSAAFSHAATSPNQMGMAMMRLNSSLIDQGSTQTKYAQGSLWSSLRKDFRINEVNPELIRYHESKFVANGDYFDRTINRSKPYMFHISTEVKKRNMPAEIALLPFIESAFVTKAKSHVGASGLWQFMPATGRHYGLEKTPLYDGRHDVYAATDAALNYIQYLHGLFNDWSLALAAYNWGEGNVGRAVNRALAQGIEPTYENLRMPNETRNYVPKLLAVRNIVNNPQTFGMNVSDISNQPYFKVASIDKPIDSSAIARLANISESEFLTLNPAFNAPVFIPKSNRKLLLPTYALATFEKNYRNASPESLLSWDVYTANENTGLSTIASETGMSINEIKRLNGISSNSVSSGRSILVAKNSLNGTNHLAQSTINFIDTDNTPDTYQSNMPDMITMPIAEIKNNNNIAIAQKDSLQESRSVTQKHFTQQMIQPQTRIETIQENVAPINFTNLTQNKSNVALAQPNNIEKAEIKPISLAANLLSEDNKQHIEKAPSNDPSISITQPISLAKNNLPEENISSHDPLMELAQASETRLNAAERIQAAVNDKTQEENMQARIDRLAENKLKQQKRIETRLARSNNQTTIQTVASGMHRVMDGDTLFNVSKRYNLSVADLIVANNIKGNNIRTGQLLKVTVAPSSKQSSIQNVSYTVRQGDTLNTIANKFNVDINDIRRWNQNTRAITPGQKIKLIGS